MEVTSTFKAKNRNAWRKWLEENHKRQQEIWLLYDDRTDVPTVNYLDSVEEAICFGWIDGIQKRINENEKAQRFTPRRPKSNWTELNKERARRLVKLGLMTSAGSRTLPDLKQAFQVPDYVIEALKQAPNAINEFQRLPKLYIRVRVGYIDEMRNNQKELERRLSNFVKNTAQGKLYGKWNDDGRLS